MVRIKIDITEEHLEFLDEYSKRFNEPIAYVSSAILEEAIDLLRIKKKMQHVCTE